jgi:MFS family permease
LLDVPREIELPLVRSRMKRVFFNLISNALEAMADGGEVRIGTRKAGNYVLIEIDDTGPGIPHEIWDRVFEPFVTAGKANGLGLGLALSRRTVLDYGGDMWMEAATGARFVIGFPLTERYHVYQQWPLHSSWSRASLVRDGMGPDCRYPSSVCPHLWEALFEVVNIWAKRSEIQTGFEKSSREQERKYQEMNDISPRLEHTLTPAHIRTLLLASLGGALEFYDFVIFAFFTTVIGQVFFSPSLPDWVRQLQTFGIFAAGYLARPLGGIVMAHYGDTLGRKRIFTFSILLMAVPTLAIGMLPTYESIGIAAPILLLLLRVLQGMAIGGEAPGGWVYVAEHAPRNRVGLAIGLLTAGLSLGILLGSMITTVMNVTFSSQQIASALWRVPFLLGGVFGVGAMFLRRGLKETPVFEKLARHRGSVQEVPLRAVLRSHKGAVISSVLSTWLLTAAIVVLILMTPSLLQRQLRLSAVSIQTANLAGTAALAISTVLIGALTDKCGLRRVILPALTLLIIGSCLLYFGAAHMPSALAPLYALAGFGAGGVVLVPITLVCAFPPAVRFSGVSFSYNVAYALFGGVTPPLVAWLAHVSRYGPVYYMVAVTFIGMIALFAAPVLPSTRE